MRRLLPILLSLATFSNVAWAVSFKELPELEKFFKDRGSPAHLFCSNAMKPQVGWVERDHKVYPFAINIGMMSDNDAEKCIPIGRECLKTLGKL